MVRLAEKSVVGMFYVGPTFSMELMTLETLMEVYRVLHDQDWVLTQDTAGAEVKAENTAQNALPGYMDYWRQVKL